jgi:hypothetical protein
LKGGGGRGQGEEKPPANDHQLIKKCCDYQNKLLVIINEQYGFLTQ